MEAGAELAGGHSIDDKEPKYGLAVTGVARPDEIVYNAGARPGDKLVLTKRLGIGVLASALKQGLISEDDMMPAIEEAAALNAAAAAVMSAVGVHACTDVSGFGLLGHLGEMLDASAVGAVVRVADVPLHDGVLELIAQAVYAGGLRSNRDFLLPRLSGAGGGPDAVDQQDPRVLALFDPQTSGGLLIAVAAGKHAALLSRAPGQRRGRLDGRRGHRRAARDHRARRLSRGAARTPARRRRVSPERKPGDPGWKPSEEDILAAQAPRPQFALRVLSVLPFILFGAFSVIAFVAWIAVVVFGAGTDRGTVWQWAAGRSAGEVVTQLALALVIGLIPVGVAVLSIWATLRGFSDRPALLLLAVHRDRLRRRRARPGAGARAVAGVHGRASP